MNKQLFITGGAKRIGKHLAHHFAKSGWNIIVHYNTSRKEALEFVQELEGEFTEQKFAAVQFNLLDWKNSEAFMREVIEQHGQMDLMIHSASIFTEKNLLETDVELLEQNMAIHFNAPFFMSKQMQIQNTNCSIIALLDTRISGNSPSHAAYLLSKKNLAAFVKMSAVEWAPNVRVNGIAIGAALPPPEKDLEHLKSAIDGNLLQRQIKLGNIAQTAEFLESNDIITGQIIYCDAGKNLL